MGLEMRTRKFVTLMLPAIVAAALFTGCSEGALTPSVGASLTVLGAGIPASASRLALSPPVDTLVQTGDPASFTLGMYAMWISPNDDCSAPVLVADYGSVPAPKQMLNSPVLFTGSPPDGTYRCLAIKMSDVLAMTPATTFGDCVAGTEYSGDIYRDGDSSWVDVNGDMIVGTGTDSIPVDSRVTIFLTRDTVAAIAHGTSPNQTLQLDSNLEVPSVSTFVWDGRGSVISGYGQCGLNPGRPSFQ
jgi:hypothetical protein